MISRNHRERHDRIDRARSGTPPWSPRPPTRTVRRRARRRGRHGAAPDAQRVLAADRLLPAQGRCASRSSWRAAGRSSKSYVAAGSAAVLLILVVPAYGAIASRVDRMPAHHGVTLFFASTSWSFYVLGQAGVPLGVAFFIWVGIFNLMVIAQFWAFANDVYTLEQGKRLFAIVGVRRIARRDRRRHVRREPLDRRRLGPSTRLMLIAAAILLVCIVLTRSSARRETSRADRGGGRGVERQPLAGQGGFALVFAQRYLLLIALLMLIVNLVNTTGEYILGKTLETAPQTRRPPGEPARWRRGLEKQVIGQFYGDFFRWVNWSSARCIQLFLVSRILKWFGVRAALLRAARDRARRLRLLAIVPVLGVHPDREDRGELDRLLAAEHDAERALPADVARSEVQGEAGDRHVLRALRRRALGGPGVRGDGLPGARAEAVRAGQPGPGGGVDRDRRDGGSRAPRARPGSLAKSPLRRRCPRADARASSLGVRFAVVRRAPEAVNARPACCCSGSRRSGIARSRRPGRVPRGSTRSGACPRPGRSDRTWRRRPARSKIPISTSAAAGDRTRS